MITILKLRSLFGDLMPKGWSQVFSDWEMLVGFEAVADCGIAHVAEARDDLEEKMGARHIVIETCIESDGSRLGSTYIVFANAFVIDVIGAVLMFSDDVKEEKLASGLSSNDMEAIQEMANLLCGSWNRVLLEHDRTLRVSQSVDDLKLWAGPSGPDVDSSPSAIASSFPESRFVYVPFEIKVEGGTHSAQFVMPFDVAIAFADDYYKTADPRAARPEAGPGIAS